MYVIRFTNNFSIDDDVALTFPLIIDRSTVLLTKNQYLELDYEL